LSNTYTTSDDVGGPIAGGHLVMFGAHVPWPTPDFPGALADGYLISTARDLAVLADVLATGRHDDNRFVAPAVLRSLQSPPVGVAPDPTYGSTYGMGLRAMNVRGRELLWHEGELATFHADFGVFGDDRTGVVVLAAHQNQLFRGDSPFLAGVHSAAGAPAPTAAS
jgi:hypothetical protein